MFWSKRKPQVQDENTDTENPMYSGTGYKEMDDSLLGNGPSSNDQEKKKKQMGAAAAAFLIALLTTWAILSYAWLPGHVQSAMDEASIEASSVIMYEPIVVNSVIEYSDYGNDDDSGSWQPENDNQASVTDDSSWRRRMANDRDRNEYDDSSYEQAASNANNNNNQNSNNQNSNKNAAYDDSSSVYVPANNNVATSDDSSSSVSPSNAGSSDSGSYDANVWAILPMDANLQLTTGQMGKSTVEDMNVDVFFCFGDNSTYRSMSYDCNVGDQVTFMGTLKISDIEVQSGGKPTNNYLNPQMYVKNAKVFKQFAASILVDSEVTVQLIGTASIKSKVAGLWSSTVKNVDINMPMTMSGIGGLKNTFSPTLDFKFKNNKVAPSIVMSTFMQNPSTTSIAEMGSIHMELWGPEGAASNSLLSANGFIGSTYSDVILMGNSTKTETFEVTETIYEDNSGSTGAYETIELAYENVTMNEYTNGWNNFVSVGPLAEKVRGADGQMDGYEQQFLTYDSLDFMVSNYLNGQITHMMGEITSSNGASASSSDVWSYVLQGAKLPYDLKPSGKTSLITYINCGDLEGYEQDQDDKQQEMGPAGQEIDCVVTFKNPFGVTLEGIRVHEMEVYFGGVAVAELKFGDDFDDANWNKKENLNDDQNWDADEDGLTVIPKYAFNTFEATMKVIEADENSYEGTMVNTWLTACNVVGGTTSQLAGEIMVSAMATINGLDITYKHHDVQITTYKFD